MGWRDGYLTVDWGTTNRRAYAVDAGGRVTGEYTDDLGILAVPAGGFEAAVAELRGRFDDRPVLLAGMIGSNRGWIEAAYVPCPAGAADLAAAIRWVEPDAVGLVPGVSQVSPDADVMRGEEVQAIGAVALGAVPPDALICHPGTHAKWIQLGEGRITAFQTMMTGELFALLKKHSILRDQLQDDAAPDEAFRGGVVDSLAGADLLSALFRLRARHLLGTGPAQAASRASGLLIGADVRAGLSLHRGGTIAVVGRSDLCALYAAALAHAGHAVVQVDGADAFLAGMNRLTELL